MFYVDAYLHRTGFLEIVSEEPRRFHVHPHRTEHDGKVILMVIQDILGAGGGDGGRQGGGSGGEVGCGGMRWGEV